MVAANHTPTFTAARKEVSAEPITFYIEGEAEPFTVHRPVPAIPLLDIASEAEDGDVGGAIAGFSRFIKGCLGAGDWARFRDAVTRARWGADDLLPVVQYIIAEATGRPTMPPSDWQAPSVGGSTWQSSAPSGSAAVPH